MGDEGRLKRGRRGKIGRVGDWGKRREAWGERREDWETGGGENWETWKTWEIGRLRKARGERGVCRRGGRIGILLATRYALLATFNAPPTRRLPAAQKSQLDSRRQAASR